MASSGYSVKAIDELASIHHGIVKLAGAELEVESFGLQVLGCPRDGSYERREDFRPAVRS